MSSSKCASILPQEILVEIVSKLPAKSLVRFKCVSKFFCSLVVDCLFADLLRNWSLTLIPSRMSILISFPLSRYPFINWFYTINYPEENQNQGMLRPNRLDDDDHWHLFRLFYLQSSANGLLCLCSEHRDDIAILNLNTRHSIYLPSTYPQRLHSRMHSATGLLGFDSVSKRYKVLKSVQFIDRDVTVKHWVFTLGVDKSWREIINDSSPPFYPYNSYYNCHYFRSSVHIDGVIYSFNLLNNKYGCPPHNRFDIVAFDVKAENFRTIPSPPGAHQLLSHPALMEVEGRLAIRDYTTIWTLEESMVWNKHKIPIPLSLLEELESEDLFFATNQVDVGEIAMLVRLRESESVSILFYNFRGQSWRRFDIGDEFYSALYKALRCSISMHFIDNVF